MNRRLFALLLAHWPAAGLLAADAAPRPRHKISAGELHAALAARFPLRFGLAGWLQVRATDAGLLLLPARNLLGATLRVHVSGQQLAEPATGEADLAFALRYQAADRTLRGHRLEVLDLRWPGLPDETRHALQALLPAMVREALGEVMLHRFSERELALADTMGFEPRAFTVTHDGLLIEFAPRPSR